MPGASSEDVTDLLQAWSEGDREAVERLMPLLYAELRRQAARQLRRERGDHSLQPTALVHEAYLRLVDQRRARWKNRTQFFAVAAQMMRRVLVDHARSRQRLKRARGWQRVALDEAGEVAAGPLHDVDLLELDEALREFQALDPGRCRLVELRFFGGLSADEAAEVLGVSPSTVDRDWRTAKAWLYRRIQHGRRGAPMRETTARGDDES